VSQPLSALPFPLPLLPYALTPPCHPCSHPRYLPIGGLKDFCSESIKLAYGDHAPVIHDNLVASVQSLSGTGSCRLMAEFQVGVGVSVRACSALIPPTLTPPPIHPALPQNRFMPGSKVYIPVPTWSNHHNIWKDAGVEQATHR
jgi:aspartate aminotransferase